MSWRAREIECLLLTMFAAVPFYFTHTIGIVPLLLFHGAMAAILIRVGTGRSAEIIPAVVMRILAVSYVFFYVFDAMVLSRDAIAASTHLVLFIAVYQPIEGMRADNRAQRLLTAALIFVAGVATSTDITIVLYVIVFTFLMFRQLMHISHLETVQAIGQDLAEPPSARAAGFYLCGTALVGSLLFPLLPRVRNPLLQGFAGALTNASTGLSDTIDFNSQRSISPDPTVLSRVWMGQEAIPFFTPLRLRGAVYDRFARNEWRQTRGYVHREMAPGAEGFRIARPIGFSRSVTVQQRLVKGTRLFLPTGTYGLAGLPQLVEGPTEGAYFTFQTRSDVVNFRADLAREISPLRRSRPATVGNYPIVPEVRALARQIVGRSGKPLEQAADIERYMSTKFRYIPDPSQIGHVMSVDDFLLHERRGHCEYFAAGMVALMTSLDVPARIVGGFYGGRFNPLTGYFVIRREDAHAWVEVWDGGKWVTFDPTPAALRPGHSDGSLLNMYASALGDSITYFWDRYILTFGLGDQVALAVEAITQLRGAATWMRSGAARAKQMMLNVRAMAGLFLIACAAVLAIMTLVRRRRSLFDLLAAHLEALGIVVGPAMTMGEALRELRDTRPDAARDLEPLIALYDAERFSPGEDRKRRAAIRKRLTELRTG
jgi:transglutaminase-like putative cysteine protease